MARAKTEQTIIQSSAEYEAADSSIAEKLSLAFDAVITKNFGFARAPAPYLTPFGIKHLDALLGGGFVSSAPIVLTSTPETGKSTLAFQFSSIFQALYANSIVVYIDIEASGNTSLAQSGLSRVRIFGIDDKRFRYEPVLLNVQQLFALIENLCQVKQLFEQKTQKEFKLCICWDSIAATPSSKTEAAEDHNKIIGFKARELSFCLEKYSPLFAHNRVTFLCIDQVRANLQLEGQYVAKEKSVGTFNDYKTASSIAALNHKVSQWLYLSKRAAITPDDNMSINGWFLSIFTEKNKIAPSQESITCVFDKRTGLHPFWSEFTFLSEMTRSEMKYFKKDEKKLPYPLAISKATAQQYQLELVDPSSGAVQWTSDKFFKKDAYKKYQTDENFKKAFDAIMTISVDQRIKKGIFEISLLAERQGIKKPEVLPDEDLDNFNDIDIPEESNQPLQDPEGDEEIVESLIE
jgi:hypothetical protein